MAASFARAVAILIDRCVLVTAVNDLVTKWRLGLAGTHTLDLYYSPTTGRYSYVLVREEQRVLAWDNAPHHRDLPNFPHHVHHSDGPIGPSLLNGDPDHDLEIVRLEIDAFLRRPA